MDAQTLIAAGIPLAADNAAALLYAEAAIEWMQENTTLEMDGSDGESIAALPACAKLFVVKYSELMRRKAGVTSQSIEGMSQSFDTGEASASNVWALARTLLGKYLKSQVRVTPAQRRW